MFWRQLSSHFLSRRIATDEWVSGLVTEETVNWSVLHLDVVCRVGMNEWLNDKESQHLTLHSHSIELRKKMLWTFVKIWSTGSVGRVCTIGRREGQGEELQSQLRLS